MNHPNIRDLIVESVKKHSELKALSFVNSEPITYHELFDKIVALSLNLKQIGIKKGDKIAILSSNSPNWGISYLSILFVGAIAVPILNDFSKIEIQNILQHSESRAIFIAHDMLNKISEIECDELQYVIQLDDFNIILDYSSSNKTFAEIANPIRPEDNLNQILGNIIANDTASIIYTSGTTGLSKGVMLSHRNLIANIQSTFHIQKITNKDRLLSILPLSHTYECTLGFLMPLFYGANISYFKGAPTPTMLIPALQKIKPTMMLSVPLVIEKIYKNKIKPKFSKGIAKYLYEFSLTRKLLNRIAGSKLKKTFGGALHFFGIGGALLDAETELFLREGKFPYAIGYGLTETSPLLAGCSPKLTKFRSTGFNLPGQELKLLNVNPLTGEGEIVAKGDNIMKGYYKNEDLTVACFTEDGWFKTGDLGYIDKSNYIYIKGRLKNMILGANGENIYPEQIEAVLNRHTLVAEAIVYELKGKLVAKVHLNYQELEKKYEHFKESAKHKQHEMQIQIKNYLEEIRNYVNTEVNKFSRLSIVIEQPVPFEKTPTQKIKKYLYVK